MRLLGATLVLCACSGSVLPTEPRPSAVAPSRIAAGSGATLTITGSGFFAEVVTDFRKRASSTLDADFTASIVAENGDVTELTSVTLVDSVTVTAELPAIGARGLYDVTVSDPRGRTGTLTGALRIVTSAESVSAFVFDAIDGQRAGVPFVVGLTAVDEVGRTVEGFDGMAQLEAPGAAPVPIGPFVLGRARAFATVAQPAAGVTLTASDALGHTGTSPPFDVTPGDAARVGFVEAPPRIAAGACGGPFTLEVQDTFGNPAVPTAASPFTLSVNPPEGGGLFTDGACGTAMAGGMLQGRSSFFVRATRAGGLELRAVPEAWPSAVREVDVDAGTAVGVEIASAPQVLRAGMCSQPVVVRSRDAFGNATPVSAAAALEIDVQPSTGVTLHVDSACASPLNQLEIAAGEVEARFHFRSAVPAMLSLSVDAGVLGVAVQGEEVTP